MIPEDHQGEQYRSFMSKLTKSVECKSYLEIGVSSGDLMELISSRRAIGVDPCFNINRNISASKEIVELFQMSSDAFFGSYKEYAKRASPDVAFLDGLHVFDYLLRDFMNAEVICNKDSFIFLHDCLPLTAEMAHRDMHEAIKLGKSGPFPDYWTGDVWKVVPILKGYRPDLVIHAIDCKPTGLICISGLNPQSTILSENYSKIIDEYMKIPNTFDEINKFYESLVVKSALSFTHENFTNLAAR